MGSSYATGGVNSREIGKGGKTKMGSANPSKDVADFLAPYAPEVRKLAVAARAFVFKMIPDVSEQVDAKARIIGYGYGPN